MAETKRQGCQQHFPSECESWGITNAKTISSSLHNHTISILRQVFQIAIEAGARYDYPALAAKRVIERTKKQMMLPESSQFEKLGEEIRNSGSGFAKPSAELVHFLAYGGFRKTETSYITWADGDFARGKVIVRGSPETRLKGRLAGETRVVPTILEMRRLLEKIKGDLSPAPNSQVMRVFECRKSITTACRKLGIARFTYHDSRQLFATRCLESGADIPTVSRWLGHKDGGTLSMKAYGHLRDQHSANMAQKVVFSEEPQSFKVASLLHRGKPELQKVTAAKAKPANSHPGWASNDAVEIYWGQANEPVQIVPLEWPCIAPARNGP